jgi:hypothetical protein
VPNRDLDLGRKEGKSRELKREVSPRASNHLRSWLFSASGLPLVRYFSGNTTISTSLRRKSKLVGFF